MSYMHNSTIFFPPVESQLNRGFEQLWASLSVLVTKPEEAAQHVVLVGVLGWTHLGYQKAAQSRHSMSRSFNALMLESRQTVHVTWTEMTARAAHYRICKCCSPASLYPMHLRGPRPKGM